MTIERREKCGFHSPKSLISDRALEKVRYQFNGHRNDLASINRGCIHYLLLPCLYFLIQHNLLMSLQPSRLAVVSYLLSVARSLLL